MEQKQLMRKLTLKLYSCGAENAALLHLIEGREDRALDSLAQAVAIEVAEDTEFSWVNHPEYLSAEVLQLDETSIKARVFYRSESVTVDVEL